MTQQPRSNSVPARQPASSFLSTLVTGLLVGVLATIYAVSYAKLIFVGSLAHAAPIGIGLALVGTILLNLVTFARGALPGEIPTVQDIPAAMLAVLVGGMAATAGPSTSADQLLVTVLAVIGATSVIMGVGFWLLGYVRLGNLVWYFPYPVVAGFMAGVGWLLIVGALTMMTGFELRWSTVGGYFRPDLLGLWLPGALYGLFLFALLERSRWSYTLPIALLAGVGLFYIALPLLGLTTTEAQAHGLLLGEFGRGSLWQPPPLNDLTLIQWPLVVHQAGAIVTVFFVTALGNLLDNTGIELSTGHPIDLNKELRANGVANVLMGLVGSAPGYNSISLTNLSLRQGGPTPITGLIVVAVSVVMLFVGGPILSAIPTMMIGALLFYLGLTFIYDWLLKTWSRLSRTDYLVVVVIFLAIQIVGVLAGVALGLLVAVLLFVISYSRISVVKHELDGTTFHSNVERTRDDLQHLSGVGAEILILELQGFLFFGTVVGLVERISRRLDADVPLRFVVLDFRQVQGFDASAVMSFAKLRQLALRNRVTLIFTSVEESLRAQLARILFAQEPGDDACRMASDLDRGVEWCEEQLLQLAVAADAEPAKAGPFANLLLDPAVQARLRGAVQEISFAPGEHLIHQGVQGSGLYFIARGQASVFLENDDGTATRIRKAGPGAIFGEMSTYAALPTSAAVIADEPTVALVLSPDGLAALREADPAGAEAFHRAMAMLMAERLAEATASMHALLR